VDVVRELYGVMAARGATSGFVVTSGLFADEAVSCASGCNVNLVHGLKLHGLIRQSRVGADRSPARVAAAPTVQPGAAPMLASSRLLSSRPMARRTTERGTNAGGDFWGCTGYPACRGTRPIG
jgi:restriction system protein